MSLKTVVTATLLTLFIAGTVYTIITLSVRWSTAACVHTQPFLERDACMNSRQGPGNHSRGPITTPLPLKHPAIFIRQLGDRGLEPGGCIMHDELHTLILLLQIWEAFFCCYANILTQQRHLPTFLPLIAWVHVY